MSKKVSWKVGDRVSIPGGQKGTVKYVGTVSWDKKIVWLGVQMDKKVKKKKNLIGIDGKGKDKKTYFKVTKKGTGILDRATFFSKVGKEESKGNKDNKKKSKKDKKDEKSDKSSKKSSKQPEPVVKKAPVVLTTIGIQTDPPEETISNKQLAKYVVYFEEEKSIKLQEKVSSLEQALRNESLRTYESQSQVNELKLDLEQEKKKYENFSDKNEELELQVEDLKVQLEFLKLDNEEYKEKLEDGIESYLLGIKDMNEKEKGELIAANNQMKESLNELRREMEEIVNNKNREIALLKNELAYLPGYKNRIKELLLVERENEQLKWDIKELKNCKIELDEANEKIKQFKENLISLEGELQDWRDYIIDIDDHRNVLKELNETNELFINELSTNNKELNLKLNETKKELNKKDAEVKAMNKELFYLRTQVENVNKKQQTQLQDLQTTNILAKVNNEYNNNNNNNNNNSYDEQLVNQILALKQQLHDSRSIITNSLSQLVSNSGYKVRYNITKAYFPNTLKIDDMGINVLSHVERCLVKSKYCRTTLEKFYADPNLALIKNDDLCLQTHYICPLILQIENYLRSIQRGFLVVKEDEWNDMLDRYTGMIIGDSNKKNGIEDRFNNLLSCINDNNLSEFNHETLDKGIKKLKDYIKKSIPSLDPDVEKKDDERLLKSQVLKGVSETSYRIYSLTVYLNQFNNEMYRIIHAPVKKIESVVPVVPNTNNEIEEKDPNNENTDENQQQQEEKEEDPLLQVPSTNLARQISVDDALGDIKFDILGKMFDLRNAISIKCKEILTKTNPVDVGFMPKKLITYNQLISANDTSIRYNQLKNCKINAVKALNRIEKMVETMKKIKPNDINLNERTKIINKILEKESEAFDDGLMKQLELSHEYITEIRNLMGSISNSTISNTDELPNLNPLEKEKITPPIWEIKASNIRNAIDEAYEIREEMKNKEKEIQNQKQSYFELQNTLKEKNNSILLLQQQIVQEKTNNNSLAQLQEKHKILNNRLEKYIKELQNQTAEVGNLRRENETLQIQVDKYKKAISNNNNNDNNTLNPNMNNSKSMSSLTSNNKNIVLGNSSNLTPTSPVNSFSNLVNIVANSKINQSDANYLDLLQSTVQSLRRRLGVLNINKNLKNFNLSLKPLNINKIKKEETNKQNEKDEQEEEKEEKDNEKQIKKQANDKFLVNENQTKEMENLVYNLSSLQANPKIVDITSSNKAFNDNQFVIGRQLKLRNLSMQYKQLSKQLSTYNKLLGNDNNLNKDNQKQLNKQIGQIKLPGTFGNNKVVVDYQNINQIKSLFVM